jgi:uncharacterized coiled-coil protein SlyX
MAFSLISALSSVPWADVASNAPAIVDGAKKVLGMIGNPFSKKTLENEIKPLTVEDRIESLVARVAATEDALQDLNEKLKASAEVINSLANQNAQLIETLNAERGRMRQLIFFALGLAAVALVISGLGVF